jgi:hypothetical protein
MRTRMFRMRDDIYSEDQAEVCIETPLQHAAHVFPCFPSFSAVESHNTVDAPTTHTCHHAPNAQRRVVRESAVPLVIGVSRTVHKAVSRNASMAKHAAN